MVFFSIIVPVYNAEKYLRQCVDSILAQTFVDFEIILVDDGSKDSSAEICDRYACEDARVKVVHKPNGGAASARKVGAQNAAGEYIVSVDSDDFIAEDFLEKIYVVIEKFDLDIVTFGFTATDASGVPQYVYKNMLAEDLYDEQAVERLKGSLLYDTESSVHNYGLMPYSIWSKAIRRSLFVSAQLAAPIGVRNGDDLIVTLPAVCKARSVYALHYNGYYYRQLDSSIVHAFHAEETKSLKTLVDFLYEQIPDMPKNNVAGYTIHMLLGQIIKAARAMRTYAEFKTYVNSSCEELLYAAFEDYRQKNLRIWHKIRLWIIRKKLWRIIWLCYHR